MTTQQIHQRARELAGCAWEDGDDSETLAEQLRRVANQLEVDGGTAAALDRDDIAELRQMADELDDADRAKASRYRLDWHQGSTDEGKPFGYIGGWFVNWSVDGSGDLAWELEADEEFSQHAPDGEEPISRREADEAIFADVAKLEAQEYSAMLEKLVSACVPE